ncbi:MAG: sigma-70 family RNA polymerase sigma factor [Dehalococcoidia bacterium]
MDHIEFRLRGEGAPPPFAAAPPVDPTAAEARDTGDDVALGLRLRARQPAALAELYRLHRRRAFGLAYRVLGDGAAAEDAVQNAFLSLWERAPRLDPRGGRVESLLMTIVHRRAVDLARARARDQRQQLAAPPDDPEVSAHLQQVVDEAAAEEFAQVADDREALRARMHDALATLPWEQRQVVELAYFDGLTYAAVAEQLALPPGTVKSRLRLAMQKLRAAMPPRGAE